MKPILYDKKEKSFTTLGIGTLTDTISCEVTEERNGIYELEMKYPVSGVHYSEIKTDSIILAKANDNHQTQPFRVYKVSKQILGIVTVNAAHISYDTADIPVSPFTATTATEAVSKFTTHSVVDNPFQFTTDKSTQATFSTQIPFNFRQRLFGVDGSLLKVYGGEFEFDRWNIYLRNNRGNDNGVKITYGKNLTDAKQDENIASLITGVMPFWYSEDDGLVTLPEKVIRLEHQLSHDKIEPHDLSQEFDEKPTESELREAANSYLKTSTKTVPTVSLSVSFVPLWQTENYKSHPVYQQIAGLERVALCDTVTVQYLEIGIDATAKVVKTVYDTLTEKLKSVDIGEPRTGLSAIIAQQQKAIEDAVSESFLEQAVKRATDAITGATNGYIVLDPPKNPIRLLIMDTPDKATAQKVWQWNLNGLGYSSTGINGPYSTAITADGEIVADFITTGTLTADIIRAGILASANGVTSLNLETGNLRLNLSDGSYILLNNSGMQIIRDGTSIYSVDVAYYNSLGWLSRIRANYLSIIDGNGNQVGSILAQSNGTVTGLSINSTSEASTLSFSNGTVSSYRLSGTYINGRRATWQTISGQDVLVGT